LQFKNPIVSVIIGEGGSGGAVALAVANAIFMLEHSIYSVISPEGCASILYRDAEKAPEVAGALKLTAQDLIKFKMIDEIIEEPLGGAHRDPAAVVKSVGDKLKAALLGLSSVADLKAHRCEKFLNFGKGSL
jgi:acetyl-CoA carboxylase carboxyl transferase subunit alpha